jgi:hypothetical protein
MTHLKISWAGCEKLSTDGTEPRINQEVIFEEPDAIVHVVLPALMVQVAQSSPLKLFTSADGETWAEVGRVQLSVPEQMELEEFENLGLGAVRE